MTGETDLARLLATMQPALRPEEWVYVSVADLPDGVDPVATVREPEGLTLVVRRDEADRAGLTYAYVAAMLTLQVHSALEAIGLTAAVAVALSEQGISCNVVAGYFHDHLFVPHERGAEAIEVLRRLAASSAY